MIRQTNSGENPESGIQASALGYSVAARKNARKYENKGDLFQECRQILKKSYESRTLSQNNLLLKLLQRSQFLRESAENVSIDFLKGIFRNAKIEIIDQRQVLVEEDNDLNYMVVVLDGKLGIERASFAIPTKTIESGKGRKTIENNALSNAELFQKLTMMAKRERDIQRASSKLQRKSSLPVSSYDLSLPILTEEDFQQSCKNIQRTVSSNEQYGGQEVLLHKTYKNRVIALERTTILVIEISFLFYWLQSAYKAKLTKNIELMKKIACFEKMEQQKLAETILSMKLCHKKKNQVIYRQGDSADNLFILLEGQIKLVKKASLFKENPNELYVDRRKLFGQLEQKKNRSKSLKKEQDILPFANLTTLYNYRPMKKLIEIGVVSSFGLFGEEEVVFKTVRQTSAIVNCLQASYYQIDYKKILEIIGAKNVDKFKFKLEQSISKKVLYRQNEFAGHIGFQNRNNMDYFYLQEGRQKESPRKFKLQKINEKMSPQKIRSNSSQIPAFYTSFNFHKMMGRDRYSEKVKKEVKKKTNQSSRESLLNDDLNEAQEKLVGISHTWNPIEKKVKQERMMSLKISPYQHEINLDAPLIDQQYFKQVARQSQRINKQFRTVRLSLGRKTK